MSDGLEPAGIGSWLPERVQRRQDAEDRAEEREARRAEKAQEDAAEAAQEKALAAYREQAEMRGEHISAMDLATGRIPARTVQDVFRDAMAAADREDARTAAREQREAQGGAHVEFGEPVIGRSWWPQSEYELERELELASDLHRDLVLFRARRNYPAAEEAARAKATYAQRSSTQAAGSLTSEVTRVCTGDGMTQMGNWLGEPV
jgi:hypothetical protein